MVALLVINSDAAISAGRVVVVVLEFFLSISAIEIGLWLYFAVAANASKYGGAIFGDPFPVRHVRTLLIAIAVIVATCFLLAMCAGCTVTGSPLFGSSSRQRITPAQTTIRQTEFDTEGRAVKFTEANAIGAGAESKGKDAALNVNADAPSVEVAGVGVGNAGATKSAGTAKGWKAISPLHVIGALVMIAGLAIAVLAKQIKTGLLISGGGAAIVGIAVVSDTMPWLFVLIPGVGLASWFIWNQWDKHRKEQALEAVVGGIETAGEAASEAKREIAEWAAETLPTVKSVVAKVKNKLRIT